MMTLTPAYGRDYKNKKAVIADFDADKDFQVASMVDRGGMYANKTDLLREGTKSVNIRYNKLTRVAVVAVRA